MGDASIRIGAEMVKIRGGGLAGGLMKQRQVAIPGDLGFGRQGRHPHQRAGLPRGQRDEVHRPRGQHAQQGATDQHVPHAINVTVLQPRHERRQHLGQHDRKAEWQQRPPTTG